MEPDVRVDIALPAPVAEAAGSTPSREALERDLAATRKRLAEQSLLYEFGQALAQTRDPRRAISAVAERMVRHVGATALCYYTYQADSDEIRLEFEHFTARANLSESQSALNQAWPLRDYPTVALGLSSGEIHTLRRSAPDLAPAEREMLVEWDGQTVTIIPMRFQDRPLGYFELWDNRAERDYDEADRRLLVSLASQAAVAVEHDRQVGEIRRRAQDLAALHTVDMAISSSLDLSFTLRVLLDTVSRTLKVDAACVLLLNPVNNLLEYASRHGFHTGALRHTQLRLGEGYAGRAALERRVVTVPNLAESGEFGPAPYLRGEAITTYIAFPLVARGRVKGVLEVMNRRPIAPDHDWMVLLEALAGQAAIAIDNGEMFKGLEERNAELALAYDSTLAGWAHALELRDRETLGHTQRVAELTVQLGQVWDIQEDELVHVHRGALLHDIGKMSIPDRILLKPGPLTQEEWAIMRRHPQYAYDMLAPIRFLRPALDIPLRHHEKWDGTGYPGGLKGDQIPLVARLFAVVDVWDALRSDRPYRPAWAEDRARAYILEQAGKHFDGEVVESFLPLVAQES